MTTKKKSLVFIIICCCLLMVPGFLSGPAGALTSDKVTITGKIPLVVYDVSVTGIAPRHATVSWKTNGDADSRVEYGTTTRYRSFITNGTLTKDHVIYLNNLLPGTVYHYQVISRDLAGNHAESTDSTFTTPAIPPTPVTPTVTPTVIPTTDDGYTDSGDDIQPAAPQPAAPQPAGPPEQQPGLPGLEELVGPELPGPARPAVSDLYPIGFTGLSYNVSGDGMLIIDMSLAQAAGADVTLFADRVEVYQHHSPGMLLTFWENNLTINNGIINRPVSRAEFETDPENATLALGTISGSVHAVPISIIQPSFIKLTINSSFDPEILGKIRDVSSRNNLELENVAYTMDVERINLPETGAADVTMTLPESWVNRQGGTDSIHVARISNVTGATELLNTEFGGSDSNGNMIFRGNSPHGTSLFVLFSARPGSPQKYNLLLPVMILIIIITALAVLVVYLDERRRKKA
jgi:hypothetical protein